MTSTTCSAAKHGIKANVKVNCNGNLEIVPPAEGNVEVDGKILCKELVADKVESPDITAAVDAAAAANGLASKADATATAAADAAASAKELASKADATASAASDTATALAGKVLLVLHWNNLARTPLDVIRHRRHQHLPFPPFFSSSSS